MGGDFINTVYKRNPEESYQRILKHMKKLLPNADDAAVKRLLK